MKNFRHILVIVFSLMGIAISAQPGVFQPGDYKDGIYDKENTNNRRFIPYTHLREADVTWEKRVWRKIDMREKQNLQLYYPVDFLTSRTSFLQVVLKYVLSGQIMAFEDEEFLNPYELAQIKGSW